MREGFSRGILRRPSQYVDIFSRRLLLERGAAAVKTSGDWGLGDFCFFERACASVDGGYLIISGS